MPSSPAVRRPNSKPRSSRVSGRDHVAAAGDRGHRERHVLDLAVAGRQLPRRARRQPAAERGAVDRGREVAEREPALRQGALEPLAVDAALGGDGEPDRVDVEDAVHALDVDRDAAVDGHGAAAHPRARPVGHDGDPEPPRDVNDFRHFRSGGGPHDDVGRVLAGGAGADREEESRPHVAGVGRAVAGARRHTRLAHDAGECPHHLAELDPRGQHRAHDTAGSRIRQLPCGAGRAA